ncbi:MAG: hypothetical protein ACTSXF_12655, partial [Promethearchaeota archaeon]
FMMVFLHTLMRWFDRDQFMEDTMAGQNSLFLVVLLIMCLFFGSWAGFFLMVSAMGNMVSMYKGLDRGQNWKTIIIRQVLTGFLLLFFAYLSEGLIGYQGTVGDFFVGEKDLTDFWWRGYHMETIHTIAWAIVLNGIVQGLLSMNDGYKKIKRNIIIYGILAVVVILFTQPVWDLFNNSVYDGNWAHGINYVTKHGWQYGDWRYLPVYQNILLIFLQPWASQVEPIFPFLSVSFIGSMIALMILYHQKMADEENKVPSTKPLKWGMLVGFLMTIGGLVGVIMIAMSGSGDPVDFILGLLGEGYDVTYVGFYYHAWLPYFILLTGSQIGAVLLILRLVEYRGKGEPFAKKTLMIRRFGFVAFSVYNYQYLDVIVLRLFSLIPGWPAFGMLTLNKFQVWWPLIGIYLLWFLVLWLWEKVDYAFGLEWFIAKLSYILIHAKRSEADKHLPWWKTSRLDPQKALHDAEWLNVIPEDKIDHANLKESKLSLKLALVGVVFFPLFFEAIAVSKGSEKTEGKNKYNKLGFILGIIGSVLSIIVIIALFVLNSSLLFS